MTRAPNVAKVQPVPDGSAKWPVIRHGDMESAFVEIEIKAENLRLLFADELSGHEELGTVAYTVACDIMNECWEAHEKIYGVPHSRLVHGTGGAS